MSINRIKKILIALNKKSDLESKSIFSILQEKNWDIVDFCNLVGIDYSLLNIVALESLENLLRTPDTRISFNPDMQSLASDEIEIYSKSLNMSLCFLKDEVKISMETTKEDESYTYTDIEYMATTRSNNGQKTIHFNVSTVLQNSFKAAHVITNKYPLKRIIIQIEYSEENISKKVKVTINNDMFQNDLDNIIRILYNYNYQLAYAILYFYPASIKIFSDEFTMNNFVTR